MNKEINKYINQFPEEIKKRLYEIYQMIKDVVPEETIEKISWRMPTFYLNGNLVHFAAFKNHIGLYPGSEAIEKFKDKFSLLSFSKGAVQFNHENPLPKELIQEIVRFRVNKTINYRRRK